MLHEIKHDGVKFKQVFSDISKVCTEALELGCPTFWDWDIYYSFQSGEEKAISCTTDDGFDFLFNLLG